MPVMRVHEASDPAPVLSGTVVPARAPLSARDVDASRWDERDALRLAVSIWLDAQRSPHTKDAYARDIARWLAWCDERDVPVNDARRGDVDAWRNDLEGAGLQPGGIARRLSAVSSFYAYWAAEDVVSRNPAANAKRPRVSPAPVSIALTRPQAQMLVTYADEIAGRDMRPGVICRLLAETGMRVGELTGARVEAITMTLGHRVIPVVRKGGEVQQLPVATTTRLRLDAYIGDRTSGWILEVRLTSRRKGDGRMDRSYVRQLLQRISREAGLPEEVCRRMHPHVLRHSAATLLAADGVPPHEIQVLLGHADLRTTQRYIHHAQSLDASPVYRLAQLIAT